MVFKITEVKEVEVIYTHKLSYTDPTQTTTKRNFTSLSLQPRHHLSNLAFFKNILEKMHLIIGNRIISPLPQVTVKADQLSFHLCMHL